MTFIRKIASKIGKICNVVLCPICDSYFLQEDIECPNCGYSLIIKETNNNDRGSETNNFRVSQTNCR